MVKYKKRGWFYKPFFIRVFWYKIYKSRATDTKEKSATIGSTLVSESIEYAPLSILNKGKEKITACALFTKCAKIGSHNELLQ